MADCSATGTALDHVIHSAISSTLRHSDHHVNPSSQAVRHAAQALGSFFGDTVATSNATLLPSSAAIGIMPSTPLTEMGPLTPVFAPSPSASTYSHVQSREPQRSLPAVPHSRNVMLPESSQYSMHWMMQQQQQMHMQMQMQQCHMAAMVEYQRAQQHQFHQQFQQQQQQQKFQQQSRQQFNECNSETIAETLSLESDHVIHDYGQVEEDDVITVQNDNDNEGLVDHASIERLARAWRDAEEEFASEYHLYDNDGEHREGEEQWENDDYDVSNIGGFLQDIESESNNNPTIAATAAVEPTYEFSPLSRSYGCLQTTQTDLSPESLLYPNNLFERGVSHFVEGDISSAIPCFESTLRNIDPEHADAWRMLGKCHTENDADSKAIVCWLKSLERDPYNTETWLALGVSYVNELDWEKAVDALKGWKENHPLYAGMDSSSSGGTISLGEHTIETRGLSRDTDNGDSVNVRGMRPQIMENMRDVEKLLMDALAYDNTDNAAADAYEALGVVWYVNQNYDGAADCFHKAIQRRPDDYQLCNKLGATLANSNRSDEALELYRMALRLKPKYARAWLNMAISHSNLRNYREAARCYLQTLSLNPEAKHVWSYLRIALTCEEKWDLLPLAASQNLSAFHEHFDFVEY